MAMSRYVAPAASAARNCGITKRGSAALIRTSQRSASSKRLEGGVVRGVDLGGREPVAAGFGRGLRPAEVVVGHDHVLEEVATGRDAGDRRADAAGADDEDAHSLPSADF